MIETEDYRAYIGNETLKELIGTLKVSEKSLQT